MNRSNQIVALFMLTISVGCGASRPTPAQSAPTHGDTNTAPATNAVSDVSMTPETEQPPAAAQPAEDLVALEQAAYERARPVFEEHCARCHSSAGKRAGPGALKHFTLDTYPFGGHHAMEITTEIREVLGVTGDEATMPKDKPGVVQGEQLALITAWADAFDRTHAAGLHSAHGAAGDGHTSHAH
jgi:mono/diheme cytochrome c family protein